MADTSFSDRSGSTAGTTIVSAWLNAVNKWAFWGRRPNYATTTGSANAQVLTLETGSLYTAGSEADGDEFSFTAGFSNNAAMTIQVIPPGGSNTACAAQFDGVACAGGEIVAGRSYTIRRLGTTWQIRQASFSTFFKTLLQAATAAAFRALITPLSAKGDLWAFDTADNRLPVGSNGQALHADSSQTLGLVYLDNPSRPNLIINPNWLIDQINEGALYTYSATTAVGPDGWSGSATGAGVFKLRTLADPDNAALKCLEITCTTADASIAAGDNYYIYTTVEGYDAAGLMAGTSSAQAITVQFKYKTSVTGVYGVAIQNSAGNRRYIGTITVADTNEHEYSVSLTMDTSGTWLYTNGIGLKLILTLSAGSTFQGTAGAWAAGAEQTTSAQANFMSVNTNIAYLKRIQLIPGNLVQAYKPADVQKELARAQRYYCKTFSQGTAPAQNAGRAGVLVSNCIAPTRGPGETFQFPSEMRAAPTIVTYSPQSADANWRDTSGANAETVVVGTAGTRGVAIYASSATNSGFFEIHATASARLS